HDSIPRIEHPHLVTLGRSLRSLAIRSPNAPAPPKPSHPDGCSPFIRQESETLPSLGLLSLAETPGPAPRPPTAALQSTADRIMASAREHGAWASTNPTSTPNASSRTSRCGS